MKKQADVQKTNIDLTRPQALHYRCQVPQHLAAFQDWCPINEIEPMCVEVADNHDL